MLPAELPDLYYEQPLQFCAKFRPQVEARLILSGRCGSAEWEKSLPLPAVQAHDEAILRTWAKACIDALLDQIHTEPRRSSEYRDEIISLALEHHLVTDFTSLVAVQEEAVSTAPAQRLKVAVPLPRGLEAEEFIGGGILCESMVSMAAPRAVLNRKAIYQLITAADLRWSTERSGTKKDPCQDLARRQKADGSWGEGEEALEWTCVTVLAFVRHDCTLSRGPYRRILEKAVTWLLHQQPGDPLGHQMRAVALWEMKQVCSHPLLKGVGAVEKAIVHSIPAPDFNVVATIAQLRLAALSGINVKVSYRPQAGEVGEIWLECLKKRPVAV